MSNRLHIQGEYPADWPEINARACEAAGHRCIRCHHPYRKGTNGNGEWSYCDEKCTHAGPLGKLWYGEITPVEHGNETPWRVRKLEKRDIYAQWRILTCHHLDGNKANCEWWNLWVLCQRCHLTIQGGVNPEIPYFLEHDDWAKPLIAGFYAKKYEGKNLTREEVMARLDELLAYERRA